MTYCLYDVDGFVADGPSVQGLEDLAQWAEDKPILGTFFELGCTSSLSDFVEALQASNAEGSVESSRVALLGAAQIAKDILILSDGLVEDGEELVALDSHKAHRETLLHEAADSHLASVEVAIRYAFAAGREAIGSIEPSEFARTGPKVASDAVHEALLEVLPSTLLAVVVDGGDAALIMLERQFRAAELKTAADDYVKIRFDVSNPLAAQWARRHAAKLAKNVAQTTKDAIAEAIADALETGDLAGARESIFQAVGDVDRARLIARNEIMVAVSEGQRLAWAQAVKDDLLTGKEKRVWISTEHARLCPICSSLEGTTATLKGHYPDPGGNGPPAHVQCRCTEGIA